MSTKTKERFNIDMRDLHSYHTSIQFAYYNLSAICSDIITSLMISLPCLQKML